MSLYGLLRRADHPSVAHSADEATIDVRVFGSRAISLSQRIGMSFYNPGDYHTHEVREVLSRTGCMACPNDMPTKHANKEKRS